ncbi:MAG: hypothetical protein IGS03_07455 [Candidatus Sericytochromatia bacterium]|nr:hypothetical protein [Candidatus Sericytochromatia bacterium]
MGSFAINVRPELVQQRVQQAQTNDINRLSQQFQLNKNEIHGDGVDMQEAPHLPLDTFMQLSGGDANISKADLLKFAGTPTDRDIVNEYAHAVASSLPAQVMNTNPPNGDFNHTFLFKVSQQGDTIRLRAERNVSNLNPEPRTAATADAVFSVINGKDLDADGQIAVAGELSSGAFVQTAGDAVRLAGSDMKVSPTEALQAILGKAGQVPLDHLQIQYNN